MAIDALTMEQAHTDKALALKIMRNPEASPEQKCELTAIWGADFAVDSTEYQISDEDKSKSRSDGYNIAKESTDGYERDKTGNWARAGATMAGAIGSIVCNIVAAAKTASSAASRPLMWAAAVLNMAVITQYFAAKPNKDAAGAAEDLMNSALPEADTALNDAQEAMTRSSEKISDLTTQAEEKNQEANDRMKRDKTMLDFNKAQYNAIKAKKDSGKALTADEQATMKMLAPKMQENSKDIATTRAAVSEEVNGIGENIEEHQDVFDESAETLEEAAGVTDYGKEFDEDAFDNAGLTKYALYTNAAASTFLATRLMLKPALLYTTKIVDYAMAGVAGIAGALSVKGATDQNKYQDTLAAEIDMRETVEDNTEETGDIYDVELDNLASSIQFVNEDLTLEVPQDVSVPPAVVSPSPAPVKEGDDNNSNPTDNNDDKDGDKDKKKDEEVK